MSGASLMVVELSAVRLLAPRFGDSTPVWTNVIGVILLALAIGAVVGGRLSDRGHARRLLPTVLFVAAGIVALGPWLAPRAADWILPEALTLDRAMSVLAIGSLATTILVFAPPVFFLGAVSPMLIQSMSGRGDVGRIAGSIYAAGTVGSLVGTFASTHLLVPILGLRGTFFVAAFGLVVAGVLALFARRATPRAAVAALVLLPFGSLVFDEPRPEWLGHAKLLETVDGSYQRLWVVGREEPYRGGTRPARVLAINEGLDSYHSIRIAGVSGAGGRYYDAFRLLAPALTARRRDARVLSLGCAGGTIVRILDEALPQEATFVGVDLDPAVLELGRKYFDMPPPSSSRHRFIGGLDARVYVDRVDREQDGFDLVIVDTYRNQIYLPVHLSSVEFFDAVKARMREGGILALNVGDLPGGGPLLDAVARTVASRFKSVESFAIPGSRNFLVVAHDGAAGLVPRTLREAARPVDAPEAMWSRARREGAWRRHSAGAEDELLRDDRSTLDTLHEALYGRLPRRAGS